MTQSNDKLNESETSLNTLNEAYFLKDFTFSVTTFKPEGSKQELELCDNLIILRKYGIAFQLKERERSLIDNGKQDKNWFKKKVLKKAKEQICDTVDYLTNHEVHVSDNSGRERTLRMSDFARLHKVVSYHLYDSQFGSALTEKHVVSSKTGFIHVISLPEFHLIVQALITPIDLLEYLSFREVFCQNHKKFSHDAPEAVMLGLFLRGQFEGPNFSDLDRCCRLSFAAISESAHGFDYNIKHRLSGFIETTYGPDSQHAIQILERMCFLDRIEIVDLMDKFDSCHYGDGFSDCDFNLLPTKSGILFGMIKSESDNFEDFQRELSWKMQYFIDKYNPQAITLCSSFINKDGERTIVWVSDNK